MTDQTGRTPAAELLLCCVRSRAAAETAVQARAAIGRNLDWSAVLRTAELQKIGPLLHRFLARSVPELVPPTVTADLQARAHRTALYNVALAAELRRVLRIMAEQGIPAIPFKGPVLAVMAYAHLGMRQFGDLDILVRAADVGKARGVLLALGYRPDQYEPGWEYHFVHEERQLAIDLHERLASRYFPAPGEFPDLQARLRPVSISGVEVPAMSPEDTLLALVIHLAKDCRERKETLSELCDVAAVGELPHLDWDGVMTRAEEIGARRLLYIALTLARDLVAMDLPGAVASRLPADRTATRLALTVQTRLLEQLDGSLAYVKYRRDVWHQDSLFHLQARERAGDKVRYLAYLTGHSLGLILTPTQRDREFLQLPGPLSFGYYLTRPIRVLRDRLTSGPGSGNGGRMDGPRRRP